MEKSKKRTPPSVKEWITKVGREYGSIGGRAAAANMTPEQRSDRARKAVAAREQRKGRA